MKPDLDRLMKERGFDGLWIMGAANHNPAMVYFTGIANITRADLIKKPGEPPVLFHYPMEREEAARSGLDCRNLNEYDLSGMLKEAGGDTVRAGAMKAARMFRELSVRGRVAVAGTVELAPAYALLSALPREAPEIRIVGESGDPILMQARSTKDAEELDRLRSIGRRTTAVMGDTAEFLSSHSVRENILVGRDGNPLRIGDVKAFIHLRLAERGAEAAEGLIFAPGREAGIPHSTGTDSEILRPGQAIIFDLYPCETGGGYFHDITRTWCLDYAAEEVEQLHSEVMGAYRQAVEKIRPGLPTREVQAFVCDLFERSGHPTLRSDPQTERGYVHNLGHGLGLNVHETPYFALAESNRDALQPGMVFTIEPGLYYPERGMGVRLENTLYLRADGTPEVLGAFPMDLVIPVRHSRSGRTTARKMRTTRKPAKSIRKDSRHPAGTRRNKKRIL